MKWYRWDFNLTILQNFEASKKSWRNCKQIPLHPLPNKGLWRTGIKNTIETLSIALIVFDLRTSLYSERISVLSSLYNLSSRCLPWDSISYVFGGWFRLIGILSCGVSLGHIHYIRFYFSRKYILYFHTVNIYAKQTQYFTFSQYCINNVNKNCILWYISIIKVRHKERLTIPFYY